MEGMGPPGAAPGPVDGRGRVSVAEAPTEGAQGPADRPRDDARVARSADASELDPPERAHRSPWTRGRAIVPCRTRGRSAVAATSAIAGPDLHPRVVTLPRREG